MALGRRSFHTSGSWASRERQNLSVSNVASNWKTFLVIRQINHASLMHLLSVSICLSLFRYFRLSFRLSGHLSPSRCSSVPFVFSLYFSNSLCPLPRSSSSIRSSASDRGTLSEHLKRSNRSERLRSSSHASPDCEPRATFAPEVGIYICFPRRQTDTKTGGEAGWVSTWFEDRKTLKSTLCGVKRSNWWNPNAPLFAGMLWGDVRSERHRCRGSVALLGNSEYSGACFLRSLDLILYIVSYTTDFDYHVTNLFNTV